MRYAARNDGQIGLSSPRRIQMQGGRQLQTTPSQVVITLRADNIQVRAKWWVSNAINAFTIEDGLLYLIAYINDPTTLDVTVYLEDDFQLLNPAYDNLMMATTIRVEVMLGTISIINPPLLYAAAGVAEIVHIFLPRSGKRPYQYITPSNIPSVFTYENGTLSIQADAEEDEYYLTVEIADAENITATAVATVIVEVASSVQVQGGGAVFISHGQGQSIADGIMFNPKSSSGVLVSATAESTVALAAPDNAWAITIYGGSQASFAGDGAGGVAVSLEGDSDFVRDTAAGAEVSLEYVFRRDGVVDAIVPVMPTGTRIFCRSQGGEWYLVIDEGQAEFTPRQEVSFLALNNAAWLVNGQPSIEEQPFMINGFMATVAHRYAGQAGQVIAHYGVAPSFSLVGGNTLESDRVVGEYFPTHGAEIAITANDGPLTLLFTVATEDRLGDMLGDYGYANRAATVTGTVVVTRPPLSLSGVLLSETAGTSAQDIHTFSANGGYSPYTYSFSSGNTSYFTLGTQSGILSLSPNTPAGTYTFIVQVRDAQGNTETASVTVNVQNTLKWGFEVDLSASDTTLTPGQSFALNVVVRNYSGADISTPAAILTYYRSNDSSLSSSDTQVGTDAVPVLAVGASSNESINVTAPSSTGTYYYFACVPNDGQEGDTSDNCDDVSVIVSSSSGGGSSDGTCSVGQVLGAGQSCTLSNGTIISVNSGGTQVCFGGSICAGNSLNINNLSVTKVSGGYQITGLPSSGGSSDTWDFEVDISASDTTLTPGQSFVLNTEVRNYTGADISTPPAILTYYRSNNSILTSSDTEIGTDSVPALAVGASSSESINVTAPSSTGTYYYFACVPDDGQESYPSDNCDDVSVNVSSSSGGGSSDGTCQTGVTYSPGDSCTHKGLTFTVLSSGQGQYSFFTSGTSITIMNSTINGVTITFVANKSGSGWVISELG
ncbi:MAG: hypothetical protein ACR2PV_00700 [Gammaproteobacteria bacterium]